MMAGNGINRSMDRATRPPLLGEFMPKKILGLAALSILFAQVVFFHLLRAPATSIWGAVAIVSGLAALTFAAAWFPFADAMRALTYDGRGVSWRARAFVVLVTGLLAVRVIPIKPSTFCDLLLIGGLIVVVFDTLTGRIVRRPVTVVEESATVRDLLAFAAMPAAVSVVMLVLFSPGIMTSDSYDQWRQVTTHRFNDWHPPLHTLLNGALRLVWNDPAMIAATQAIAMAAAAGLLIALARRALDAPRWAAYLASTSFAFHPLTSLLTITLWKDVFYTVGVILVTSGAIAMTCFGKHPIAKPSGFLCSIAVCIVCLAFRHNGGPLLVSMTGLVFLLVRDQRRHIAALFASAVVLYLLVNGPLMTALGVVRVHIPFTIASHHIAAHLAKGEEPRSEADKALLASIGQWSYNCATVDPTIFNPGYKANVASANASRLVTIAKDMALASPRVEAKHLGCVSSLVWRISVRDGEPYYLATTGLYSVDGRIHWLYQGMDKTENSPLGDAGNTIRSALYEAGKGAWFNRPALYLYLLLFACAVAFRRDATRWRLVVCVATAAVAQSASLMLFNVAQDARYQLPVYVMALCLIPCLLTARARWCRAE